MITEDSNNKFFDLFKGVLGAIGMLLLFLLPFICSSCKLSREVSKSGKDSIVVSKTNEGNSRIDSSGTKSDKTNTKETVYYPQPIYIQGKDGETKTVFVPQYIREIGTEKTEQSQIIKDTSWKDAFNSLAVLISSKESQTTAKAFDFWQILALGILGLIVLYFIGNKFLVFRVNKK